MEFEGPEPLLYRHPFSTSAAHLVKNNASYDTQIWGDSWSTIALPSPPFLPLSLPTYHHPLHPTHRPSRPPWPSASTITNNPTPLLLGHYIHRGNVRRNDCGKEVQREKDSTVEEKCRQKEWWWWWSNGRGRMDGEEIVMLGRTEGQGWITRRRKRL